MLGKKIYSLISRAQGGITLRSKCGVVGSPFANGCRFATSSFLLRQLNRRISYEGSERIVTTFQRCNRDFHQYFASPLPFNPRIIPKSAQDFSRNLFARSASMLRNFSRSCYGRIESGPKIYPSRVSLIHAFSKRLELTEEKK